MKTKILLFFAMFFFIATISSIAQVSKVSTPPSGVTKTVGTSGGDFVTLKDAFSAINANVGGIYSGIVTLQLIDNTTETVTPVLTGTDATSISPNISLTNAGSGYTAPSLVFGGGGTGAAGFASFAPTTVSTINVTNGGSGYTSAPTVAINTIPTFAGSGATATATLAPGSIASITTTTAGSAYTSPPTISFTNGTGDVTGSGAIATCVLKPTTLASITVLTGGTGYTTATVTLTGGGYTTAATATATIVGGVITASTRTAGAGYTTNPTVTITGDGTGATAKAIMTGAGLGAITVTNGGSGYIAAPTVIFTPVGTGGTGAVGTAALSARAVASVTVTAPGTGYTALPNIIFSGGAGSGATASAVMVGTALTNLYITNGGTGYTSPTVSIADATGTGATGTVTSNTASFTSVNIYPTVTGLTISSATTGITTLFGAKNVTIDGRLHDNTGNVTGSGADLTLATSSVNYSTIALVSNAQNNTIKYCTIKGSTIAGASGVIQIGPSASAAIGNGNNTIDNNLITNGGTRPQNGIYADGNSSYPTTGNQITNNNFKDLLSLDMASVGIVVMGATMPSSAKWTITGNNFYETTAINPNVASGNYTGIQFAYATAQPVGPGNTISGNYFGGSAPKCGGTPLVKGLGTGNHSGTYTGIWLYVKTEVAPLDSVTTVSGNYVQNFNVTNSGNGNFRGICFFNGDGNITGNWVGDHSSNGNITYSVGPATGGAFMGIQIGAASCSGTLTINNNHVGSIWAKNPDANYPVNVAGINITNNPMTITQINGNKIGSETVANSMISDAVATGQGQTTVGIANALATFSGTISNDTIASLTNACPASDTGNTTFVVGIQNAGGGTMSNNVIHDLKNSSNNVTISNTRPGSVVGIYSQNITVNKTISGNKIYNLNNNCTAFSGTICGISCSGSGTNTLTQNITGNFIYGFNASSDPAATPIFTGIQFASGVTTLANNIITFNPASQTTVNGILEIGAVPANNNTSTYFNTVYIGGTPTTAALNSYCYYSTATLNNRTLKNNLFINARSNSGAAGSHYAIGAQYQSTKLITDYNDYLASGIGGKVGVVTTASPVDKPLITDWAVYTTQDVNSLNIDPAFANAGGTTAGSYYTSSNVSLSAVDGTGTTTDFVAINRTSPTRMGAFHNNSLNTITRPIVNDADIMVLMNQTGIVVPLKEQSNVELYTVNGMMIDRKLVSGAYSCNLSSGIYIIRVNGQSMKFVK